MWRARRGQLYGAFVNAGHENCVISIFWKKGGRCWWYFWRFEILGVRGRRNWSRWSSRKWVFYFNESLGLIDGLSNVNNFTSMCQVCLKKFSGLYFESYQLFISERFHPTCCNFSLYTETLYNTRRPDERNVDIESLLAICTRGKKSSDCIAARFSSNASENKNSAESGDNWVLVEV